MWCHDVLKECSSSSEYHRDYLPGFFSTMEVSIVKLLIFNYINHKLYLLVNIV